MIQAYHVSSERDLTVIEPNICNDPHQDGLLYGMSVACFTTTTYEGNPMSISVYPRDSVNGATGYRYRTEFDPSEYSKFQMTKSRGQVHFLLLKRASERENAVANVLRYLSVVQENLDWDHYFPGGQPNDYAIGKEAVNVMFWHAIPVKFNHSDPLDKVKKRGDPFVYSEPAEGNNWWLEQLFQRIPDEKCKYLEQKANAVARRKAKQNAAKSKVQEEESSRTLIRAERTIAKQRAAIEKKEKEEKQKQKIARAAKKKLEEEVEKKKESDLNEEKAEMLEPDEEQKDLVNQDASESLENKNPVQKKIGVQDEKKKKKKATKVRKEETESPDEP